jgi:hypothetical protein
VIERGSCFRLRAGNELLLQRIIFADAATIAAQIYVRIGGPILLENPFYEPAAPPVYELCSAWFLIVLSMPEKISA